MSKVFDMTFKKIIFFEKLGDKFQPVWFGSDNKMALTIAFFSVNRNVHYDSNKKDAQCKSDTVLWFYNTNEGHVTL